MSKVKNSKDDIINYIEACISDMQQLVGQYQDGEYDDDNDFFDDMEAQCTQVVAKINNVDWKNLDWKV